MQKLRELGAQIGHGAGFTADQVMARDKTSTKFIKLFWNVQRRLNRDDLGSHHLLTCLADAYQSLGPGTTDVDRQMIRREAAQAIENIRKITAEIEDEISNLLNETIAVSDAA